ncbi:MAG: deoxyribodipyrimidine photo-lyase [Leptolyngbya sp. SIO3F4]|nr:deoxyribodipyrimidine photo-lyase [Leptolyngbya sp. SIO3F4]
MSTPWNVVWFKRDLRLQDHAPLATAVDADLPVLLVYILETSLLQDENHSERHTRFILESIADLNRQLQEQGTQIQVFHAEAQEVFTWLQQQFGLHTVFSHEETGLRITYDRDVSLATWFREQGVVWNEFQSNGVERGRSNRQDWSKRWHIAMNEPVSEVNWDGASWVDINLSFPGKPLPETTPRPAAMQPGGETTAHRYMQSFLYERGTFYSKHISKPEQSRQSCSRLSPYLAWGNLSIRQVYQAYKQARTEVSHKKPLAAFATRLRWHCHFIQKFEMEDRMEFEPYNSGYNLLEKTFNPEWFEAWKTGTTGYPLVDACMRAVNETGYLNFRMRAMVVSFWTHHLWQPWKPGAIWLAQQFLDFEPGIHYAQFHMQAGATGINTIRIYNPVKQAQDHDPDGSFVHRWVPELSALEPPYLCEPWKLPPLEQERIGFRLGEHYPHPIIDIKESGQYARKRLWSHRNHRAVRAESKRILQRHTMPNRQP